MVNAWVDRGVAALDLGFKAWLAAAVRADRAGCDVGAGRLGELLETLRECLRERAAPTCATVAPVIVPPCPACVPVSVWTDAGVLLCILLFCAGLLLGLGGGFALAAARGPRANLVAKPAAPLATVVGLSALREVAGPKRWTCSTRAASSVAGSDPGSPTRPASEPGLIAELAAREIRR